MLASFLSYSFAFWPLLTLQFKTVHTSMKDPTTDYLKVRYTAS